MLAFTCSFSWTRFALCFSLLDRTPTHLSPLYGVWFDRLFIVWGESGSITFRPAKSAKRCAFTVDGAGFFYAHGPFGLLKIGSGKQGTPEVLL